MTKILTEIFQQHIDEGEECHGFEIKGDSVELWLCGEGYKYYENSIPLTTFHKNLEDYFNK